MLGRKKKAKQKPKTLLGKAWYFIWEDNSPLSWLANVVLAFVLIKFLVYPGLGLVLGTTHPVVAVVSGSMEHNAPFGEWWKEKEQEYAEYAISRGTFEEFTMKNGFDRGDIIVLRGVEPQNLKVGEVIVFQGAHPEPIIHRVINGWTDGEKHYFRTKGDNNVGLVSDELRISEDQIIGRAWLRLPFIGYVKIGFTNLVSQLVR